MIYGNGQLLEYVDQLVVVPRICEHCLEHDAVYYCCAVWPATYVCCACLRTAWFQLRQDIGQKERGDANLASPLATRPESR